MNPYFSTVLYSMQRSVVGILLVHLAFSGGKCLVIKVDTVNILQDKHKARGMDWFEEDLYVITPKT